jgi:hypothetical protein
MTTVSGEYILYRCDTFPRKMARCSQWGTISPVPGSSVHCCAGQWDAIVQPYSDGNTITSLTHSIKRAALHVVPPPRSNTHATEHVTEENNPIKRAYFSPPHLLQFARDTYHLMGRSALCGWKGEGGGLGRKGRRGTVAHGGKEENDTSYWSTLEKTDGASSW